MIGKTLVALAFVLQLMYVGSASANEYKKVDGDGQCPSGFEMLSYDEAERNKSKACGVLGEWDIVRLADGGSISGSGYNCTLFPSDDRAMGTTLCRPQDNHAVTTGKVMPKSSLSCSDVSIEIDKRGRVASLTVNPQQYAAISQHNVLSDIAKNKIYGCFKDEFDFIFFVRNSQSMGDFSQFHMNTPNPSYWGSEGKLQGINVFPALSNIAFGATLHEIAHQWMNNIIPTWGYIYNPQTGQSEIQPVGKDHGSHWGVSDADGQMGGFDKSKLVVENGLYTVKESFGWNNTGGNSKPYSQLELYLMGLVAEPPKTTTVYTNLSEYAEKRSEKIYGSTKADGSRPYHYETYHQFRATPKVYTASEIDALSKGSRPPYTVGKRFRALTVVLTQSPLTQAQWDEIDTQVDWFTTTGATRRFVGIMKSPSGKPMSRENMDSINNFYQATQGGGVINAEDLFSAMKGSKSTTTSATSSQQRQKGSQYSFSNMFTGSDRCLFTTTDNQQVRLVQCTYKTLVSVTPSNQESGDFYLMIGSSGCLEANTTGRLQVRPCNGSDGQNWMYKSWPGASNHFQLLNVLSGDNQCLDVINDEHKDKVHMAPCGNYSGQSWTPSP